MNLLSRFSRTRRVERQAYRWVMKMLDDPISHAARLERWLSVNEEHRAVFKRASIEVGYASDAASQSQQMKAVLSDIPIRERGETGRNWIAIGATLATAALVAALIWRWPSWQAGDEKLAQAPAHEFRTSDGPKIIDLDDHSRVTLLANSVLLVHFTPTERGINLNVGRARFAVAHDIKRPFTVYVPGGRVTAVGTLFDVDASAPVVRVHLITGKVLVTLDAKSAKEATRTVALASGQEISIGQTENPASHPVASDDEAVKTETFDDVPLSEVIGKANALSPLKITLGDPTMGSELVFAELNLRDIRGVARKLAILVGGTVDDSTPGQLKIVKAH